MLHSNVSLKICVRIKAIAQKSHFLFLDCVHRYYPLILGRSTDTHISNLIILVISMLAFIHRFFYLVGWGCRICLLHLCKGVGFYTWTCFLIITIWWWSSCSGALGYVEYPFITITLRSAVTLTSNTSLYPIYGSNGNTILETIQLCTNYIKLSYLF